MISSEKAKNIFTFSPEHLGYGGVCSAWSPDASFIAIAGENRIIRILDRLGKLILEFPSNQAPRIEGLGWDKDNDSLAILTASNVISIWSMGSRKFSDIDMASNKEKATFISWSSAHSVLCVGTDKGSLVFYNRKSQRKIPCISKHGKKVTYGDWNAEGLIITCSEDKLLTISNQSGDTTQDSFIVKAEPTDIKWCPSRDPNKKIVAAILGQKAIIVLDTPTQKNYMINFQAHQGKVVTYQWYGEDHIVVGFSTGLVSLVSVALDQMGVEKASVNVGGAAQIEFISINYEMQKLAVAQLGVIKFYSMTDWAEIVTERLEITKSAGKITNLHWSKDGSIMTVTTGSGYFFGFLTVVPSLCSACDIHAALLSSLTEISIVDCGRNNMIVAKTNLDIEPAFLKLGPSHFAVGINNSIWYYKWRNPTLPENRMQVVQLVCKREYFGTIKQVVMNDTWTAVLSEGKVSLHMIEDQEGNDRRFPQNDQEKPITFIALVNSFLLLVDTQGKLKYYLIDDNTMISEHRSQNPIVKVFPNKKGTKVVCVDNTGNGYLFCPVDDSLLFIPNFQSGTSDVIWDLDDPNIFVTVDKEKMQCYMYVSLSLEGPAIIHLPEFLKLDEIDKNKNGVSIFIDKELRPIIMKSGFVYSHAKTDGVRGQYLTTHNYINSWRGAQESDEGHLRYFLQNLVIHKFQACMEAARTCVKFSQQFFETLGKQCLKYLELQYAETAFQMCKNVGMVYSIQSIKQESEKNILMGHVASILFKHDIAQECFLKSSKPELALEMRMDLQDWFAALKLCKQISPEKEQFICRKLASQVENQGNTTEAQKLYEKALLNPNEVADEKINIETHNTQCYGGIARTAIKMGDIQRGFNIANELNDKNLVIEIAGVCENMKQWTEAAKLYQKGQLVEKAASIYIQIGMFQQAAPLIDKITSPSILVMVAKAKEAEKNYREAEKAYERANDYENIIRLNLDNLDNPEKAKHIFRTKSQLPQCALMIAQYCEQKGFKKEAIEFLVLGGKKEDAFVIAQSHQEMDEYAKIILKTDEKNNDEHLRIAQYYEGKSQWGKAAKHYEKSEQYNKALKLYIADGEKMIPDMIEMVAKVKLEALTHELVDYLMGEKDNNPKEPQWTFKLYRAIGNVKQAVKIAVNIAQQEQELGNYKYAHDILLDTFKDIRQGGSRIPHDLNQRLLIIHSFILAKRLVKLNDHLGAARMLIRVATNISQFPTNMVNILTSTVAECTKANLKQGAFNWACILVRPEHRGQIPPNFAKKVEAIARKPVKQDDDPEAVSPCPYCKFQIPETRLECLSCKNNIPFCIASGKHMILSDWSQCPSCRLPAIYTEFKKMLENDPTCPMCEANVPAMSIQLASDPESEFKQLTALMKASGPDQEGDGQGGNDEDEEDDEILR